MEFTWRQTREVPAALLLLLALPACDPSGADAPRLGETAGVDPAILARIDGAFAAAGTDPDWKVELAMVYDANELRDLARETYLQCLAAAPERPELWYHLARMQAELSDPEGAVVSIERCLALAPDYAPAHWRHGEWLLALGRLDAAEKAFRTATRLDPGEAAGWLGLARVRLQRDDPRGAIALLEPVVERDRREAFANALLARAYRLVGEDEKADTALMREERAAPARRDDPWTARVLTHAAGLLTVLEQAGGALAQGDAGAALALLEPLHRERPDEFAVVELYAKALIQAGQAERALPVLAEARERHPESYLLELSTGRALQAPGQHAEALPHLERAVALNPSFGEAHAALGESLFALERLAEAERAFRSGLALDPDHQLRMWMLLARAQIRQEAYERALGTLEEALLEYPNSADLWAYKADALVRSGRAAEARAAIERVTRRRPDHELLAPLRSRLADLEAEANDG